MTPNHRTRFCSSLRKIGMAILTVVSLAGCRLYEPNRYPRLEATPNSLRVLMVGDSLTYYNDLPGLLQQFSKNEARPIYIEQVTFPLRSLGSHWNIGKAPAKIRDGHFDYVILQDFSRLPATDPETCIQSYDLFSDEAKRAGSKTIVFENWTRRGHDDDFFPMQQTYNTIVARTKGIPAPIGPAFQRLKATRPDIGLLKDDRHPTDAASYLAACVLYNVLYRKNSADLPWDLPALRLPNSTMSALRTVADQAVNASHFR